MGDNETQTTTVKKGATLSKPETPTKDGYEFVGWYVDETTEFGFNKPIENPITLYAKWNQDFGHIALQYIYYVGEAPVKEGGKVTFKPTDEQVQFDKVTYTRKENFADGN